MVDVTLWPIPYFFKIDLIDMFPDRYYWDDSNHMIWYWGLF